jgi:CubicO group peptidase (beta-lactamase class C family)
MTAQETHLGLPRAERPEQIGLSSERLDRITAAIGADVERGAIPGAVLAIARAGRIGYAAAIGYRDREAAAPMRLDAIFRIASMTKPMTSIAAMMLGEEGRLDIAAPVAEYIADFKNMTVGIERTPAKRTMTVQDLLRHTSGLTYAAFGDSPVQMLWRDADLMAEGQTNEELVGKLGKLPLMTEPGTTWEYSMSTDVLGRVVEVVAGKNLAEVFAERITGPLGMVDTAFSAAGDRAGRVAEPQLDKATGKKPPMRNFSRDNRWHSGGGGLASTAPDYLRFCQMLLNGGQLEGHRLLSRKSIELMTARHSDPIPLPFLRGQYFGLGVAVQKDDGDSGLLSSPGTFGWSGAFNTYFRIDPKEQVILLLLVQRSPANNLDLQYGFQNTVMQAIAD